MSYHHWIALACMVVCFFLLSIRAIMSFRKKNWRGAIFSLFCASLFLYAVIEGCRAMILHYQNLAH